MTMNIANKLLVVAAISLMSGVSVVGSVATAQSTAGTGFVVVMRSGVRHELFTYGWKGISATTVFGADEPYDKAKVRIVCLRTCPKKLPTGDVREDTVTWKEGPPTVGRVDGVFCNDLDMCTVSQGDRRRDSQEMAYVQFAPS
jgi:hypothetical protein